MDISRRKIIGHGLNFILGLGGVNLFTSFGKKVGLFTVCFTTYYPKNKSLKDYNLDQPQFFKNNNVDLVDKHLKLRKWVLSHKTIRHENYHTKVVTFLSKQDYLNWEHELSTLSLFNQTSMNDFGYKMTTTFYS